MAVVLLAERGKNRLAQFYNDLNDYLAGNQYTAGDEFSIADITALCTIDFGSGAARVAVPDECEHLKRWHKTVSARPSAQA